MIWIVLAGIATILFYWLCVRPLNYWKERGVKQGNPWPLFGDSWKLILLLNNFYELVEHVYKQFPNSRYFGIYQFTTPTLYIRDLDLIRQVTVKDFDHFDSHRMVVDPEIDNLWGKNLFALKGQKWRNMRNTLSPSFTSSKMRIMYSVITETAENFVNYFKQKSEVTIEVDMKDAFTRYANDVIASSAFGIKVNSLTHPKNDFYLNGIDATNLRGVWGVFIFLIQFIAPKIAKKLNLTFLRRSTEAFFTNLIKETIKIRREQDIIRPDMINLLLQARKGISTNEEQDNVDTGFATAQEVDNARTGTTQSLTDDEIASQAFIFFIAGFDTVSTAMCFIAYELAMNPDIQDKLRGDILDTWKKCDGKLTYEDLLGMKYLDMIVSETLRKWPPIPVADRLCTKTYTIEPITPDEPILTVEKGSSVMIPILGIQRDPKYFLNPDKFDPERFSDENKSSINPYTYMPFGLGPRNCIGSRFALLEIKAVLFHMLKNFKITPSKKLRIPLRLSRSSLNVVADGGFWFDLHLIRTK